MIGLVIVTHGGLASEFLSAMEHVVGPQRGVAAICIGPEDDMERRRRDIVDAAAAVDDGEGVILLTDMFGGTPSNLAISVMEQTHAEVIAGLNLPMLIKLASVRVREPLEACVAHAQDAGRKYISVASWVLAGGKVSATAQASVGICNQRGLHARASAKFVKLASSFEAEIKVTRDGVSVDARSIMGLLMLGAGNGCDVSIEAEGADAVEAVTALSDLVTRRFDEDV